MKNIAALLAVSTLLISFNLFSEEHKTESAEICTPSETQKCDDAKKAGPHSNPGHGAASEHDSKGKDWSHKRQEQVAHIFPGHEKNKAAVMRPEKVQLTSPAFLAKVSGTSVKLEWTSAGGAQNYHVQVSKDAGFNNRSMFVAEDKFVAGTTFEVAQLEPGVKYFWRVAAHNKNQESSYTKSLFVSSSFETAQ